MLAIGRGLMAIPKLLILDEPSLGLSPLLVSTIFATLKEINSRKTTIFLVEQNVLKHCLWPTELIFWNLDIWFYKESVKSYLTIPT